MKQGYFRGISSDERSRHLSRESAKDHPGSDQHNQEVSPAGRYLREAAATGESAGKQHLQGRTDKGFHLGYARQQREKFGRNSASQRRHQQGRSRRAGRGREVLEDPDEPISRYSRCVSDRLRNPSPGNEANRES